MYKIHVYFKTLSLVQLMHVDLNMCFKINKTKSIYERGNEKTFNSKQTTQIYSK